jgi:hypothetical protein
MKSKKLWDKEFLLELCFYLFVFFMILGFILLQPFGEGPDESNRYKVTEYIRVHGELPHGAEEELHIVGYGASYAFQPILSYIIQGYLNRFISLFTTDFQILLLVARLVNAITGVIMAVFVRKISKLIFDRPIMAWAFTMGICLLPQNLFIHSYVNTDSMAALSYCDYYLCLNQRLPGLFPNGYFHNPIHWNRTVRTFILQRLWNYYLCHYFVLFTFLSTCRWQAQVSLYRIF